MSDMICTPSQRSRMTISELAEVIHNARWPADRQMAVTPFADEDRNGREYCFRIARAVEAAIASASPPEQPAADPFQPHENCNCLMCIAEKSR
jgi:hypothetical protein